jgi:hypothetical protein
MPSLHLTPGMAVRFLPLPGSCLLRVSPTPLMHGSLHLPENAAEAHEQLKAMREGVVVRNNPQRDKYLKTEWLEEDLGRLVYGVRVFYQGHMDEMDNQYVVVKHGQIWGVLEE